MRSTLEERPRLCLFRRPVDAGAQSNSELVEIKPKPDI
jgi:hypothetical protein